MKLPDSLLTNFRLLLLGFVLLLPASLRAQSGEVARHTNASQDGTIKHKVQQGETLSAIARRYQMSITELSRLNQLQNADKLREGQELLVKAPQNNFKPVSNASVNKPETAAASAIGVHTVQQGETLHKIAIRYGVRVDSLRKWNRLSSDAIQIDQRLHVTAPANTTAAQELLAATDDKKLVHERGMASRINGSNSRMRAALHRTAPVGSFIRVYNESTRAVLLVKVIGTLPDVASEKKVVVKLSKAACEALGALDDRFPVQVSYEK